MFLPVILFLSSRPFSCFFCFLFFYSNQMLLTIFDPFNFCFSAYQDWPPLFSLWLSFGGVVFDLFREEWECNDFFGLAPRLLFRCLELFSDASQSVDIYIYIYICDVTPKRCLQEFVSSWAGVKPCGAHSIDVLPHIWRSGWPPISFYLSGRRRPLVQLQTRRTRPTLMNGDSCPSRFFMAQRLKDYNS